MNRYSAFCHDCLGTLDATAIAAAIRQGEFSLDQALTAAIERAQRSQPVLNAIAVPDFDRVGDRAKRVQAMLVNSRINAPSVLKDNINLAGLPTRFGSKATPSRAAAASDELVDQLHASGMHFIAKSTTPAFGFSCSTEFDDGSLPTRNPWNLSLSPGGSSGGSAALVAAGVVPIAHANDGGGSIRIPAAMCGVIGLKPSRGRLIPQPKAKAMPINIVSDGVITRSMRDQANFYFEAEKFFSPPNLQPIGSVEGPGKRRLRIGFLFDSYFAKACPETRRAVETTVAKLAAAGHEVEETRMPVDQRFADDFTHYWSFMAFSIEYMGWMFFGRGEAGFDRAKLDGLTKGLSRNFRQHFFRNLGAIRRLRAAESRLKQELWRFDAVVSPVVAKVTPELGYFNATIEFGELLRRLQEYVGYTPMENVLGNPAIALPMGQSDRGDPIGVQISAPTGEERRLLELGFELEAASSWKWLFQ